MYVIYDTPLPVITGAVEKVQGRIERVRRRGRACSVRIIGYERVSKWQACGSKTRAAKRKFQKRVSNIYKIHIRITGPLLIGLMPVILVGTMLSWQLSAQSFIASSREGWTPQTSQEDFFNSDSAPWRGRMGNADYADWSLFSTLKALKAEETAENFIGMTWRRIEAFMWSRDGLYRHAEVLSEANDRVPSGASMALADLSESVSVAVRSGLALDEVVSLLTVAREYVVAVHNDDLVLSAPETMEGGFI